MRGAQRRTASKKEATTIRFSKTNILNAIPLGTNQNERRLENRKCEN